MNSNEEIVLAQELLELQQQKSPYLDEHWERPTLERYISEDIFARERQHIFQALPHIAAHSSELPNPGDYITVELGGRSMFPFLDVGAARDGPAGRKPNCAARG